MPTDRSHETIALTAPKTAPGLADEANAWLTAFERGLKRRDSEALAGLFLADCHWRDLLALTWDVQTLSARDTVIDALVGALDQFAPTDFRIAPDRTAPGSSGAPAKACSKFSSVSRHRSGPARAC